jgi:hypothetical protein
MVKEIPGVPIAVSQCSSIHSAPADGTMTDPNPLRICARNFERGLVSMLTQIDVSFEIVHCDRPAGLSWAESCRPALARINF